MTSRRRPCTSPGTYSGDTYSGGTYSGDTYSDDTYSGDTYSGGAETATSVRAWRTRNNDCHVSGVEDSSGLSTRHRNPRERQHGGDPGGRLQSPLESLGYRATRLARPGDQQQEQAVFVVTEVEASTLLM